MHHIFHTEAIILESKNHSEADKMYTLLTKDLGIVRAIAKGSRLLKSKARYGLVDFDYVKVDLIKGRDIWRIGSVSAHPFVDEIKKDHYIIWVTILKALLRLSPHEEHNPALFRFIVSIRNKNNFDVKAIEIYAMVTILSLLGYWEFLENDTVIFSKTFLDQESEQYILENKSVLTKRINQALAQTQL